MSKLSRDFLIKLRNEELAKAIGIPKLYLSLGELQAGSPEDELSFKVLSEIKKDIINWVDSPKNNLYIWSTSCGNGKTSWAASLALAYSYAIGNFEEAKRFIIFINTQEYLENLKQEINKNERAINYLKEIRPWLLSASLVIWDDFALKAASDYERNQLYIILDRRIGDCKANIFTSNVRPKDLNKLLGERIASRVGMSQFIELRGDDRRADSFFK